MNAENLSSIYAFTGNPIVLSDMRSPSAGSPGSFDVRMGGRILFQGRFIPPVSINIAEIAAAACPEIPEVSEINESPMVAVESQNRFLNARRLDATLSYGTTTHTYDYIALPGGISKQNFQYFADKGADVFDSRFLNPKGNFFLTTRSAAWRIVMRETEVCPLYFISAGSHKIEAKACLSGATLLLGYAQTGIYAVDPQNIRRRFFETCNLLPSVFDIVTDDVAGCRIVIRRSEPAKDRFLLKFRNSFGVFDRFELSGAMTIKRESDSKDSEGYTRHNYVSDDFDTANERIKVRENYEISTGIRYRDEIDLLLDMLSSDDIYLKVDGGWKKVLVKAENLEFDERPETPFSTVLTLTDASTDSLISTPLGTSEPWTRPRIFSNVFSKQFN